jgi:hypothetical protein
MVREIVLLIFPRSLSPGVSLSRRSDGLRRKRKIKRKREEV